MDDSINQNRVNDDSSLPSGLLPNQELSWKHAWLVIGIHAVREMDAVPSHRSSGLILQIIVLILTLARGDGFSTLSVDEKWERTFPVETNFFRWYSVLSEMVALEGNFAGTVGVECFDGVRRIPFKDTFEVSDTASWYPGCLAKNNYRKTSFIQSV